MKRPSGRPKGSKSRDKGNVALPGHLRFMQSLLQQILPLIRPLISVSYLLLDSAYGYNEAM